jgi:hypothetical protein
MDYDYAKYLRALLGTCLAIGLKEQADRIRKLIADTKATIAKRKELEKQEDTMSSIMKKYLEKVNNSRRVGEDSIGTFRVPLSVSAVSSFARVGGWRGTSRFHPPP